MYFTPNAVLRAIGTLRAQVHPFIGITFVACKRYGLSAGEVDEISVDALTRAHMDEHHKIDRRSKYYFQPFTASPKWWVVNKYPSSGLQTVNTQTFRSTFIHERDSKTWGFASDYLDQIESVLKQRNFATKIPADALAIWLLKDVNLDGMSSYHDVTEHFFKEYNISDIERERIFSERAMDGQLDQSEAFSSEPLEMNSVTDQLPEPPDSQVEGGRTISSLRLRHVGPAPDMMLDFGQRLTVVTGDNGLGKSFLLDFAWWVATGLWADREALPQLDDIKNQPEAEYILGTSSGRLSSFRTKFDLKNLSWSRPREATTIEALAVFSRADGSFAISDPIRGKFNRSGSGVGSLTAFEVWNGRAGVIEGLIRDWIRWQSASNPKTFDQFSSVLKRLSPEDLGTLTPGEPIRIAGDPREIPTIRHRYATVPITHASSGVQRVLLLAYLIIWSWQEHVIAAERLGQPPLHRMMVIVDELEAHLHPKWQRIVLPALMGVGDLLSSSLAMQIIAATHSPMILASLEATFDDQTDALYHLYGAGPTVKLEEIQFVKYGDATGWLTSPLFGLRHARSRDAEAAIEAAKHLQLEENPNQEEVASVSRRLRIHLAGDDKFWPRWLYFAEQHGVEI